MTKQWDGTDPTGMIADALTERRGRAEEDLFAVRGPSDPLRASVATNQAIDDAQAVIDLCDHAMTILRRLEKALDDAGVEF